MTNSILKVLEFYELCANLKTTIRTGWQQWNVAAPRLESVAEHIYGTCMLAIAIYSEFKYDIDLNRVIFILVIHELEETIIGDITDFQGISKEEKHKQGRAAVEKILCKLTNPKNIASLIKEYQDNKTPEARFAQSIDKLECGLQCKIYDRAGFINPHDKAIAPERREHFEKRNYTRLSDSWLEWCVESYGFDENFINIARAARKS